MVDISNPLSESMSFFLVSVSFIRPISLLLQVLLFRKAFQSSLLSLVRHSDDLDKAFKNAVIGRLTIAALSYLVSRWLLEICPCLLENSKCCYFGVHPSISMM